MSKIIEALRVRGVNDIRYVKSLHLDSDVDKVDETSPDDLITQLARIKKLNVAELERGIEKAFILSHLRDNCYATLKEALESERVSVKEKMAMLGRPRRNYILERMMVVALMGLLVCASFYLWVFILPKAALWICGGIYWILCLFKVPITLKFNKLLALFYFIPFRIGR